MTLQDISWDDLKDLKELDFQEFLESDLLSSQRKTIAKIHSIRFVMAPLSLAASIALICHILRSPKGLSTTYHRLLLGLSVADIMSSLANSLNSAMTPQELDYLIPNSSGSTTSCSAQGCLIWMGAFAGSLYNSSISFYYLAIIRYGKKEHYIRRRLEPWFHAISIVIPLVSGSILVAAQAFNLLETQCFISPNRPPHCIGYGDGQTPHGFSIPCGRGNLKMNNKLARIINLMGQVLILSLPPGVIFVTMLLMIRTVASIEKKLSKYGVASLRLRVQAGNADATEGEEGHGENKNFFSNMCTCTGMFACLSGTKRNRASKSNNATSKKRAILRMAFWYALAWFLTWVPYIMSLFPFIPANDKFTFMACLNPLQGFFNFWVYMSPKIRDVKRCVREDISWRRAFVIAWMGKSAPRVRGGTNKSTNKSNVGK